MELNSLFVILLLLINTTFNVETKSTYDFNDCYEICTYLENNIDKFRNAVNELCDDSYFKFNYIQNKTDVYITSDNAYEKGLLIDFDDENGYMLFDSNLNIYEISSDKDSPLNNINSESFYYSSCGGFYYKLNDSFIPIDSKCNNDIAEEAMGASTYPGQVAGKTGCGAITKPDLYIQSKYNSNYKLVDSKSIYLKRELQLDLSCYLTECIKNGKLAEYAEANCPIVSAYHFLQCLQRKHWSNIPSSSQTCYYDPYTNEPSHYLKRFDIVGNPKYSNIYLQKAEKLNHFPVLYRNVRLTSIELFDKFENMTYNQTCQIIDQVSKFYNHDLTYNDRLFYHLYTDEAINNLKKNIPSIFSVLEDQTYGSHTVAVNGFRKYVSTEKVLFFNVTKSVILLELADGWYTNQTFYDVSNSSTAGALVIFNL